MPDHKFLKKLAKAKVKASKKASSSPGETVPTPSVIESQTSADCSPAERSADAAEKQLQLHRWKVAFGAISALIALVSLIVLLVNS